MLEAAEGWWIAGPACRLCFFRFSLPHDRGFDQPAPFNSYVQWRETQGLEWEGPLNRHGEGKDPMSTLRLPALGHYSLPILLAHRAITGVG